MHGGMGGWKGDEKRKGVTQGWKCEWVWKWGRVWLLED